VPSQVWPDLVPQAAPTLTSSRPGAENAHKESPLDGGTLGLVLALSSCTYSPDEPKPSPSSPSHFASLERQIQLFIDEGGGHRRTGPLARGRVVQGRRRAGPRVQNPGPAHGPVAGRKSQVSPKR